MQTEIMKLMKKAKIWYLNCPLFIKVCLWIILMWNICYEMGVMFGRFLYNILH